jgi:hypothetical protein
LEVEDIEMKLLGTKVKRFKVGDIVEDIDDPGWTGRVVGYDEDGCVLVEYLTAPVDMEDWVGEIMEHDEESWELKK